VLGYMCMGVKMLNVTRDVVCLWNANFGTESTFDNCKCVSVTLRCVDVYRSLLTF